MGVTIDWNKEFGTSKKDLYINSSEVIIVGGEE